MSVQLLLKRVFGLKFATLFAALVSLWAPKAMAEELASFDPQTAAFSIAFKGLITNLSVITTTVLPKGSLQISTTADASADIGDLKRDGKSWIWSGTEKQGLATLRFQQNDEVIRLNVFVLTPWKNGAQTTLNGYKIGAYSQSPFRGLASYRAPKGFIEVTPELRDLFVSPHFRLGQFLCKQQPGHDPTYVLIQAPMLMKLEQLLEAANNSGYRADSFTVMSGFRTPWYNRSIGNTTTSSRHLFGGAADIYIDRDGDGNMDDLNNDGEVNIADAKVLASLAEYLSKRANSVWPNGGLSVYPANALHGPFVHVDSRGYRARWGQ